MINGKLTDAELTTVDGWARLNLNTARAYLAAKAFILLHYGIALAISSPLGAYRTIADQVEAKRLYGILASVVGYSTHGFGAAFDEKDVAAVAAKVGGIAALDAIMARFGFARNASNGSGGTEEWHYALVAVVDLAGVSGMHPALIDPLIQPVKKARTPMMYLRNAQSGEIAAIPEGGLGAHIFTTVPDYEQWVSTVAIYNGIVPEQYRVVQPPSITGLTAVDMGKVLLSVDAGRFAQAIAVLAGK
jgi:hypothetical protein